MKGGLYVHVPFCGVSCDFCAFDKQEPQAGDFERYLGGVEREAAAWESRWQAETVFWGGGTPGLLRTGDLRRLGAVTRRFIGSDSQPEWTIEMTPYCATKAKLAALAACGVTRVSLGVQTFQPRLLAALGRPYDPATAFAAVDRIRAAGDFDLNLDLIIAIPGQTPEELEADLATALSLDPDHVSAYCLTVEDDTPLLFRFTREGHRPDEEFEADRYCQVWERLTAAGFSHYEVSNFARPGRECRHNLDTWRMRDWLGLGPSAASQVGDRRFRNHAGLAAWLQALSGASPRFGEEDRLTAAERAIDRVVFGLRTAEGVSTEEVGRCPSLEPVLAALIEQGLLQRRKDRFQPTTKGLLVSDALSRELLSETGEPTLFLAGCGLPG